MSTVKIGDELEKKIEDLEETQYDSLRFIKHNLELIQGIQKRERLRSIAIMLLALSQLLLALRPIIQHLLG